MKSTRISVLLSEDGQGWWTRRSFEEHADRTLMLAKELFGPGGTKLKRPWFHRRRFEWVENTCVLKRTWCDIYFKDPKDATWFQLKKDSLSYQMS
jgi:hypothetical protein